MRTIFKLALLIFVLSLMGLLVYGWSLSEKIEKRFSGRRWSIPSKVFSDITLLYPGQRINQTLFYEKLHHLGYREVMHQPVQKGEMRISKSAVEIFLRDLDLPSHQREALPVRIALKQNRIQVIKHLKSGEMIPILVIEPEEIMLFFGPEREHRKLVSIQQVPPHLVHAVLAAEDTRFFDHHGIDPLGIMRAMYVNLRHGSIRQGGSTLTQQLAKNYFLTSERTFTRKFNELIIALILEWKFEKNEILEIYLNEIYLGQKGSISINGIGEASSFYFGKSVDRLTLAEAATLAGLIKAPNLYSPYKDGSRCLKRRNAVLRAMHGKGWLSDADLQSALSLPVDTVGFAAYGKKAPYFIDYLSTQLQKLYSPEALSSLGLSIYTTLDTQVQAAAEAAVEKGLARLERSNPGLLRKAEDQKLQAAVIVMQPKTGAILAMVGGRNYNISQFNRIIQAKRQPGSAIKPFVYLTALDTFTPVSILSNEPRSYEQDDKIWQPKNFEPFAPPEVTLRTALAKSYNLATIDLAMQVGLERIINTAMAFDFSTPLKTYPSLALGAFEVIPMELARAYCVFASDGIQPYPLSLKEVVDENGKILERRHMNIDSLISPAKAFLMTSLLQSVVEEGTARSLKNRGIAFPVAGKTGTTNESRDAWFVGYTPDILAVVWVGFDNGDSIAATGSAAALPIWADLIKNIPQYISGNEFNMPPGVIKRTICTQSGRLADENTCPQIMDEYFLEENVPTEVCPLHSITSQPRAFERFFRRLKNFAQ